MSYELFSRVALRVDIPEKHLKRGDIAMIVERHPGEFGKEEGYSLEVFNAIGDTIAVIVIPSSAVESLHRKEVLHVRQLEV